MFFVIMPQVLAIAHRFDNPERALSADILASQILDR
jgi:hypothetical protein